MPPSRRFRGAGGCSALDRRGFLPVTALSEPWGGEETSVSLSETIGDLLRKSFANVPEELPASFIDLLARLESAPGNAEQAEADRRFKGLLMQVLPQLRGYARHLCRGDDLADDMVQDAIMRAWKARSRFEEGSNFKAWMFRILQNGYFSYIRRAKRMGAWDERAAENILQAPAGQEQGIYLEDVGQALNRLPEHQRTALLLVGAEGLSYEEAALVCAVPVGTIKSRVTRARAALTRFVDGVEEDKAA